MASFDLELLVEPIEHCRASTSEQAKVISAKKKFETNTLTPCQPALSPTARRKSEERVISVSEWLRFCGEVRMAEEAPVATENTSAVVSTCFT